MGEYVYVCAYGRVSVCVCAYVRLGVSMCVYMEWEEVWKLHGRRAGPLLQN